nr:unnamed protein product [Callosobruchus analis]
MDDTEDTFIDAELSDGKKGDPVEEGEYFHQVDVSGFPERVSKREIVELINDKLKLHAIRFKYYPYKQLITASFKNEVDMENAIQVIHQYVWKDKLLSAQRKLDALDDCAREDGANSDCEYDEDGELLFKKNKADLSVEDKLRNSFIPLWKMEYKDQLELKQKHAKTMLQEMAQEIPKVNPQLTQWVQQQMSVHDGMPYPDTKEAAVGCKLNYYAFQDMLRTKMFRKDQRYVKEVIVRSAKDQLVLLISQHPSGIPPQERERFEKTCIEYFTSGPGKSAGSFYEYPLDMKIGIYPDGYYATHSEAAEILYKTAIELIGPVENSTVIDLCCGVGPLGLSFGKHCKQVLGLDTVKMCTNFAKQNAARNGIKNAQFFTGRADDLTGTLCHKAQGDDVVVVCDPPKAGLNERAIIQLRNSNKVRKLLYVSINPKAGLKVYKSLTREQSDKTFGEPFLPTKAVAIDMIPHTRVLHLITVWERCSSKIQDLINNKLQLNGIRFKFDRTKQLITASFKNEVDMEKAVKVIHQYVWKDKVLSAQRKSDALDNCAGEDGANSDCDYDEDRKLLFKKNKADLSVEDKLRNSFTPLWKMEYKDQAFQDMLRTKMLRKDVRHVKEVIVRSAKDQLLLLINQQQSGIPPQKRERFEKTCIEYFSNGPGKSAGVTSLYSHLESKG